MKLIQTTLTRATSGQILVHGSDEDKDLDCVVAHTVAPTFLKVREIAEAGDALANPGKTLAAILEAIQHPTLYKTEEPASGIRVPVAPEPPAPTPGGATSPRAEVKLLGALPPSASLPEGFGRVLSEQECADGYFPLYRKLLDRARAALEEDGRMRGKSPLLDDIYSLLGK